MNCSRAGSSVHGNSLEKNTGVGCSAHLQGTFPTQGLNPGLLHCRWILYHLSHPGNSRILEWVAYPFSEESLEKNLQRNWTGVSCTAGRFFKSWVTSEAWINKYMNENQENFSSVKQRKSNPWKAESLRCAQLFATLCTAAHQVPLSMRFSLQEYWNG